MDFDLWDESKKRKKIPKAVRASVWKFYMKGNAIAVELRLLALRTLRLVIIKLLQKVEVMALII